MEIAKFSIYKYIFLIIFSLSILSLIYRAYTFAIVPQKLLITYDKLFSVQARQLLSDIFIFNTANKHLDILLKNAQTIVPAIKGINRIRLAPGIVQFSLISKKPLILINNNIILASDGTVFDAHLIKKDSIEQLYKIIIPNFDLICGKEAPDLVDFAQQKMRLLYKTYTVTWFDKTKILLEENLEIPENRCKFYITYQQILDENFFKNSEAIKTILVRSKNANKISDMRFRDYAVISVEGEKV